MNTKQIRQMLEHAIEEKNQDFIKTIIRAIVFVDDIDLSELRDLYYPALLALSFPKKETRGRKISETAKWQNKFFNYACVVKAKKTGKSFSKTWEMYAESKTRPKIEINDAWRCEGILKLFAVEDEGASEAKKAARYALRRFKMNPDELN